MIPIVAKQLEDYCVAHTTRPDPLFEELAAYTQAHCQLPQMLTGPVEGRFLKMLVEISGARHVLEIGTYTGYSALSMAAGLPVDGMILTCDIDPKTTRIAQSFWARSPGGSKIQSRLGPALDTLAALPPDVTFDFVFLDADKENYLNYYEAVLPRLKPGGLIAADNTLWSGKVLAPKEKSDHAIVAFNARVAADPRVEQVLLSVRDGILLIHKK
jgi:caffeoyl-CoA O-methyltransferase